MTQLVDANVLGCTHVACDHATRGQTCTGHCARRGCPNDRAACDYHRAATHPEEHTP